MKKKTNVQTLYNVRVLWIMAFGGVLVCLATSCATTGDGEDLSLAEAVELSAEKIAADRQNLEYVYRELKLQISGEVSDESARSIGKFLGVDLVVTEQFTELGDRYRANAINVESATRDSVTRLDVRRRSV